MTAPTRRPSFSAGAVIALVFVAYVLIVHGYVLYAIIAECRGGGRFGPCVSAEWFFYGVLGVITFLPVPIAIAVAALWRGRVSRSLPRMQQLFVIGSGLFALVVWVTFSTRWRGDGGPGGAGDWLAVIVPAIVIVGLLRAAAGQHASWRYDVNEDQH